MSFTEADVLYDVKDIGSVSGISVGIVTLTWERHEPTSSLLSYRMNTRIRGVLRSWSAASLSQKETATYCLKIFSAYSATNRKEHDLLNVYQIWHLTGYGTRMNSTSGSVNRNGYHSIYIGNLRAQFERKIY